MKKYLFSLLLLAGCGPSPCKMFWMGIPPMPGIDCTGDAGASEDADEEETDAGEAGDGGP
jgi:hypothetical protein